ncbi:MAG: hypothetical protein RLZZ563_2141, partial [Pseudomonadota bacterium]
MAALCEAQSKAGTTALVTVLTQIVQLDEADV